MPGHCYGTGGTPDYPQENNVDFKVKWNADVTGQENQMASTVDTETEATEILCDI